MPGVTLYRSFFEMTLDPLVTIGRDGKITDANRMTQEITGFAHDELIGTDFSGYFTEPVKAEEGYRRVFSEGLVRDYPLTIRHRDGRLTPVLYNAVVYRNDQGRVLGVFAAVRNMTEQRRAEEALLDSEMRLRTLFVKAPIGIAIVNERFQITDANEMACRMLGYTREELCRLTTQDITHPDDRTQFVVMTEIVVKGGLRGYDTEKRYLRNDGTSLWVRVTTSPVYHHDGRFLYYLSMFENITDRKIMEAERQKQRDELIHMGRLVVLNELAASLAHEINQPLAAIQSNTQSALRMLESDTPDLAEVRDALLDMLADNRRISTVIRELRSFLKKDEAGWQPLDLNRLITEVLGLAHSDLVIRNVSARSDLSPDLPPVKGNRTQLQQVVLNLIINACEAVEGNPPESREIILRTRRADDLTVLTEVSDNGSGFCHIPENQVFELFSSTKKTGLGLGLATCRSILDTHGGKLTVRNNPDKGASVTFTLPVSGDPS